MKFVLLKEVQATGVDSPLGIAIDEQDPQKRGLAVARGEGHRLIVGPPGSGKFWAAIAPLLLTADAASMIVYDVKTGEAFRHTSRHRQSLGEVLKLDPYAVTGDPGGGFNPLDVLTRCQEPDQLYRLARKLTDAIVLPSTGRESSDYFDSAAKDFLTALLLQVTTSKWEQDRTLGRVRDLVLADLMRRTPDTADKWEPHDALCDMLVNTVADGFVNAQARKIIAAFETGSMKRWESVQDTLATQTEFLQDARLRASLKETTLPIAALRNGVATLYIVTSSDSLPDLGRWLRLVHASLFSQLTLPAHAIAHDEGTLVPLHVILDEFPHFGKFQRVANDMATGRGFGIHFHVVVQQLPQLARHYGRDGWHEFVPAYVHVLGADDSFTAQEISKMLGTRPTDKHSTSKTRAPGGGSSSSSVSEGREPEMHPHEVRQMPRDQCLVIGPGDQRFLKLQKWWAYDDVYLSGRLMNLKRR